MYCGKCGAKNEDNVKFCSSCGNPLESNASMPYSDDEYVTEEAQPKTLNLKKFIIPAVIAVAVIIVAIVGIKVVSGLNDNTEVDWEKMPVVYLKDGEEMMLRNAGKDESFTLTDDAKGNDLYSNYVRVTKDGKMVFFADDIDENSGEYNLYYRKTNEKTPKGKNADDKGVKIDSKVTEFQIIGNGEKVFYIKGGKLYVSNLKAEAVKIASGVSSFNVCDDEKNVIYRTDSGGLYVSGIKKKSEAKKVASGVTGIEFPHDENGGMIISPKEFYFRKDDKLYLYKGGKEPVKVCDDVAWQLYDGATLLVGQASDEAEYTVYGSEETKSVCTLYKVDGTKMKEIATNIVDYNYDMSFYVNEDLDGKEYEDYDEYNADNVLAVMSESGKFVKLTEFDREEATNVEISADRKYLYCIENWDDEAYTGTLVRYSIKNDGLGEKVKLSENVSNYYTYEKFVAIGTVDDDDKALGLYDGSYKEISTGNYSWLYSVDEDGTFYYLEDFEEGKGTLVRYKNGKKTEIDDHVYGGEYGAGYGYIEDRSSNLVYYIKDYNTDKGYGDLYINKGKKSELVDEKVTSILY